MQELVSAAINFSQHFDLTIYWYYRIKVFIHFKRFLILPQLFSLLRGKFIV